MVALNYLRCLLLEVVASDEYYWLEQRRRYSSEVDLVRVAKIVMIQYEQEKMALPGLVTSMLTIKGTDTVFVKVFSLTGS